MKYFFHERTAYCKFRKLLLIMRLIAFLLLVGFLHAGANGFTQTVTLSVSNMPLDKVCKEIEKQTGYYFVYAKDMKEKKYLINVNLSKIALAEALTQIFEGLPFSWQIFDKIIVVNTATYKTMNIEREYMGNNLIEIKGRITNSQGEPLVNASIICKKSGRGTATNENGEFKLKGINSDDILIVSYTGYKPQIVRISGRNSFTLVMDVTDNELDKTVVQAYGTTSRRLTTGNIGVVRSDDIEKQPIMNPLQALQGRIAGVVVSPTSGYASGPFTIEIRGRNGIGNFPSDPLYIIDGVPLTTLDVGGIPNVAPGTPIYSRGFIQNGFGGPADGQSPFFSLNPLDIESIEVLKDADATAIFGSRGANGVVLITSKKGKSGKARFDVNIYQGLSSVTRYWHMLDTREYLQMRREAFRNNGLTPNKSIAPDLLLWDTTRYTDWQKYLWGNFGKTTSVQTNFSGGDAYTTFRISVGYNRGTDILTVSGANQKISTSFSFAHHTHNQKLSLFLTSNYSYTESQMINLPNASTLPPNAPAVFDSLGSLNYAGWAPLQGAYPFSQLLRSYSSGTNFLNTNLVLNYQFIKGFSIKASFGYNNAETNQISLSPIAAQNPTTNPTGEAEFGNNRNNSWIIEPQMEYAGIVGKGKLDILVGGSAQTTTTDGLLVSGFGYTNDNLLRTISNAPTKNSFDNFGKYRYSAVFGRANYNLEDKYILSLNARRDGSSRFGPGKQFGNFGSLGVAWIISNEEWLKRAMPSYLSFMKLRYSYGATGGDEVGDYAYLTRWSSNDLATYNGVSPLVPLQHSNREYHWQVNRKEELAFNMGLLGDKINLELAYYRNRCNNQLVGLPTPIFTGFSEVTANSPANVQNSGWEFVSNAKIFEGKRVKWSINLNVAINKNKLLSYPNLELSPYANLYKIGEPLNITWRLHFAGVNPQTGQYSFQDRNHDGLAKIDYAVLPGTADDDRFSFNLSPKYSGGLGSNFSYDNLQLSVFFYFKKQISLNALNNGGYPGFANNQPIEVLNRWKNPGDISSIARFTTSGTSSDANYHYYSDGIYTDASFIRLANLSISYNLQAQRLKKMGMTASKIFLQGQNLIIITKYKGIDPEVVGFGGMPPAKVITIGLSCNF